MRYHLDFQKPGEEESMYNPAPRKKFIIFYGNKRNGYEIDHYEKIELLRIHSTSNNFFKKGHIIDYIYAKLILKYSDMKITKSGFLAYKEEKEKDSLKIKVTTTKRMITKIKTWLERYNKEQSTLLIPNYENPTYIKATKKLNEYQLNLQYLVDHNELPSTNLKGYV